jgi:hypothetical protein
MIFLRKNILFLAFCLIAVPFLGGLQSTAQEPPSCAMVRQALIDHDRIKSGLTRRDVEKYFVRQGGVQFPGSTFYVYPKCSLLHVDVDFTAKGTGERLFSPDDVVTKVSQLYVDYPAKD